MSLFEKALKNIAAAVADVSSLDVTTFKGTVEIKANTKLDSFDQVLTAAKANQSVKMKVLASTKVKIDGDIEVFYDTDIDASEKAAHTQLVVEAAENRRETVEMIKDIVGDAAKTL